MHKTKTFDEKIKKQNERGYVRKKTYDCRNIINLDQDTSEMIGNINKIPTFTKKVFLFNSSKKLRTFNNNNTLKLQNKNKNSFNISLLKHCNSITTNTSSGEKAVKKVTFSTVEIIRVEKYKKYNALSNFSKIQIQKNMEDLKQNDNESVCLIF